MSSLPYPHTHLTSLCAQAVHSTQIAEVQTCKAEDGTIMTALLIDLECDLMQGIEL